MSQRYGTVHARFWTDEKVQAWNDKQKLAALYLLTGPHSTLAGAMRMPLAYMAADLGWSLSDCRETVNRLSQDGFATYCGRSSWCVINKRLEYDAPKNPASLQGVFNVLDDMPRSHPAWPALFVILQGLSERFKIALPWSEDDFGSDEGPSGDGQETVSGVCAAPAASTATVTKIDSLKSLPVGGEVEFDQFWQAYPRKVGKGQARTAFRLARRKVELDEILAGVTKAARGWVKDGTKPDFIPYPATWLNGERWSDQPTELPKDMAPRPTGFDWFAANMAGKA